MSLFCKPLAASSTMRARCCSRASTRLRFGQHPKLPLRLRIQFDRLGNPHRSSLLGDWSMPVRIKFYNFTRTTLGRSPSPEQVNPEAAQLWRAPRWALAVLLALLGMLGPFSIDTYIPAFSGIARALGATPVRDAADAVGLPVRVCLHEPVPWRAGRQFRPAAGGAVGHRGVHASPRPAARCRRRIGQLVLFRGAAGPVDRRRHRGVARRHPRHVPARAGAEGDEPGHDLLRRGAGHRAHHRRLAVRARWLAQHLLVPDRRGRGAVDRQLPAAAGNPARRRSASRSTCAT